MFTNIDGFANKKNELIHRINQNPPHIICIVEVFSKQELFHDYSSFFIDGYYCLHSLQKNIHRGVVTFVRNDVSAALIPTLNELPFDESVWVEISMNSEKIVLGNVYRNWSSDLDNHKNLCRLINEARNYAKDRRLVIVGDFNYKDVNWISCSCPEHADKHTLSFLQGILINNLNQHVKDFTRQRGNDQPSTLDLIFTNYATDLQNIVLESPLGKKRSCCYKILFARNQSAR